MTEFKSCMNIYVIYPWRNPMAKLSRRGFLKQLLPLQGDAESTGGSPDSQTNTEEKSSSPPFTATDTDVSRNNVLKARILGNCLTKQGFPCDLCRRACEQDEPAVFFSTHGFAGIAVDRCQGCGRCVQACPLSPKAIFLTSTPE